MSQEQISAFEEALTLIQSLSPDERIKLRERLDETIRQTSIAERELEFKRLLIERGLVREIRSKTNLTTSGQRTLITVTGEPLSETIIAERR